MPKTGLPRSHCGVVGPARQWEQKSGIRNKVAHHTQIRSRQATRRTDRCTGRTALADEIAGCAVSANVDQNCGSYWRGRNASAASLMKLNMPIPGAHTPALIQASACEVESTGSRSLTEIY